MAAKNRSPTKSYQSVAVRSGTKASQARTQTRLASSKKSDIKSANLYTTTGYVRPQGALHHIKPQTFEMIMLWRSQRTPFTTQKLEFKAGNSLASGWREANHIRDLLISAGGFHRRDMKLIAVSVAGALLAYQDEYKIKITTDRRELRRAIRKILSRSIK